MRCQIKCLTAHSCCVSIMRHESCRVRALRLNQASGTAQIITVSTMNQELKSIEYASMLYDFYGSLLRENQNEVMALYHEDNLSLSEIASELGMTRQAVHYTLKKAEKALKEFENKLGLVESYSRNQELAEEAVRILNKTAIDEADRESVIAILHKITE